MRTKNRCKQVRLTEEKRNELDDFLKDNNITFQDLIEPYIDAVLENKDDFETPDEILEKIFIRDMCKK